jgi:pimeloyl-ACP methyl ester carboxylesterase
MLHESPWSANQFEPAWPLLLAADVRPLAMDTPGFGLSDGPSSSPDIEDYASVVPYVLDAAGVPVADILGHHTGAAIAVESSARFRERMRKLVLHGVPLLTVSERAAWRQRVVVPGSPPPVYSVPRKTAASLLPGERWWFGHAATFRYELEARLSKLTLPMLLITNTGELIDEYTRRAARLRPDAAFVDLSCQPGATVIDDDTAAWVDAVVGFLSL